MPFSIWILSGALVCAVPAIALYLHGTDLSTYFEFPPSKIYVNHASFSWIWWMFYAVSGLFLIGCIACTLKVSVRTPRSFSDLSLFTAALLGFSWVMAWNRWDWAYDIQRHTFLFLWISYILFMNAMLYEIHGVAPLSTRPVRYLLSFPLSTAFWWVFEFLNRCTQNWQYINVETFTPVSYTIFASLSFSTVLPSLWVTKDFISKTILIPKRASFSLSLRKGYGFILLALSLLDVALLPFFPDYLFASIWVAPIIVPISLEALRGRRVFIFHDVTLWAVAGVWCGFLWEMWNTMAMAKWIYHVPFVERFHLFEMPMLGYGGYIPFGVLCGLAIQSLKGQTSKEVAGDEGRA